MSDAVPHSGDRLLPRASPGCESLAIGDLAREVLRRRLRNTRRLVKKLARGVEAEPDFIHRLRVSIRRSEAALRTFDPLLPDRRTRRLCRGLKRLRRLAGEIRDVDVFIEHWSRVAPDAGAGPDLTRHRQSRAALAEKLQRRARGAQQRRLRRSMRGVLGRVRWRRSTPEPCAAGAAPELLRPIALRCLASADVDLQEVGRLHRFRIGVKRLRYACEFLPKEPGPAPRAVLLRQLCELQQRLGDICDRATRVRILEQSPAGGGVRGAAVAGARNALASALTEFLADWERSGRARFREAVCACLDQDGTSGNLDVDRLRAFLDDDGLV